MVKLTGFVFMINLFFLVTGFPVCAQETDSLKDVFPDAARFEPFKPGAEVLYYKAYGEDGKFSGVVFHATAKGYAGPIETLVGMGKDLKIKAVKVLSMKEVGPAAQVGESGFLGQFAQKSVQDIDKIQAISGATLSSKSVLDSVRLKAGEIIQLLKNEGLAEKGGAQ